MTPLNYISYHNMLLDNVLLVIWMERHLFLHPILYSLPAIIGICHRENYRGVRFEFIVSTENYRKWSVCLLCVLKNKITQPYAKKFGLLLVNNNEILVNLTILN